MNKETKEALFWGAWFIGGCMVIVGINKVPYLPEIVMSGSWGFFLRQEYDKLHNGKQR